MKKQNTKEKVFSVVHILSLEGKILVGEYINKEIGEDGKETAIYKEKENYSFSMMYTDKKDKLQKPKSINKWFGRTLSPSMDLKELFRLYPDELEEHELKKTEKKKYFTKAIIDVSFDRSMKMVDGELSTAEIRKKLYEKGFSIDGVEYVEYKRSSSKARTGSTLFIKKNLYEHMMYWSRLGLSFDENEEVDVAGLRAYESLTLSGLDTTGIPYVTISRDNILIINSFESVFCQTASVTELPEGEKVPVTQTKETEFKNDIWDGQCLVDERLFKQCGRKDKGMMLLRNRFFKACAFNTKMTDFFRQRQKARQETLMVYDMFGEAHEAKNIKMIITPSCLKFLKFKGKFNGSEQDCYNYWLSHIDEDFGICKSEKPSHYPNINQLSYQMLNSMPLSKEDVEQLLKLEIEYINKLKIDDSEFLHHIAPSDKSLTREWVAQLMKRNIDFTKTDFYLEYKTKRISEYVKNIKHGKVKILDTDYATICSNVYEMLEATLVQGNKFDKRHQMLKGYQVYCPKFDDGVELVGFRNPHIATGNVLLAQNTYKDKIKRYFNLTDNIVVINAIECQIFDRLQGNDMDSDTVMLSTNPILVEKAKECQAYKTPVNRIKIKPKPRKLTANERADVDNIIKKNKIGEIVNLSQVFNSLYWERKQGGGSDEELEQIYNNISQLSSLSQLEIDKAKKYFDKETLHMDSCLTGMRAEVGNNLPKFFQEIHGTKKKKKIHPQNKANKIYTDWNCPMNYLVDVLAENKRKAPSVTEEEKVDILDLLKKTTGTPNEKQIKAIREIVEEAETNMKKYHATSDEEIEQIKFLEDEMIDEVAKYKLGTATIADLLRRAYSTKSRDEACRTHHTMLTSAIAHAHMEKFIKVFIESDEKIDVSKNGYWYNLMK